MKILVLWLGLISWGGSAEAVMLRIFNLCPVQSPKVEIGWGESFVATEIKSGYGNDYMEVPMRAGSLWVREAGRSVRSELERGSRFKSGKFYSLVVQQEQGRLVFHRFEDEWRGKEPRLRVWAGGMPTELSVEAGTWGKWEVISSAWRIALSLELPPPETVRVRYRSREGAWLSQDYGVEWEFGKSKTVVISERSPGRLRFKVLNDGALLEKEREPEN